MYKIALIIASSAIAVAHCSYAQTVAQRVLCTAPASHPANKGDARLVKAVKDGDLALAQSLLDSGSDPDSSSNEGFSVLHSAITEHHNRIVQLLIQKGANVNSAFGGSSPLSLAQLSANREAFDLLVRNKAKLSDYDLAREELRKKGVRNYKDGLANAIKKGDLQELKLFLRAYADINEPIVDGITPLHVAAVDGSPETIRFLVSCGANVNARTRKGAPVLWFARERPANKAVLQELGAVEEP